MAETVIGTADGESRADMSTEVNKWTLLFFTLAALGV